MAEQAVFGLRDVSLVRNGSGVLDRINWTVAKGMVSVLLGPTGSGKTSLLRLLNRLDEPTSGEITYFGESISSVDIGSLRRRVGMVFQKPFLFEGKVRENILYGANLHGLEADISEIGEIVGIDEKLLDADAHSISVGQAQKVSIARAIALTPDTLLMDEPTSGLDPTATLGVESLVSRLVAELELTCVFVTHDMDQAGRVGRKGAFMIDGRIVEEGEMGNILDSPADERTLKFIRGELH